MSHTAASGDETGPRWWSLDRAPRETLRAALERTLREAILSGALRAGVRLPASRQLARELHISRGVVSDAYDQLASQGLLIIRARSAAVVAQFVPPLAAPVEPEPAASTPRLDLDPSTPDVTLFPLRRWAATAHRVARECDLATLEYRDSRGERGLREALADHLGRTRGVIADPQQVIVTQGTARSVDLLLRVLRDRGAARVAVEDPSDIAQHQRVKACGLELVAQPTDADGLVVDGLAADVVLVTPGHQFPTGSVLSGERRRSLVG